MLPDRRRGRLTSNEGAAIGRVVGDSILFKSDFSRAEAAEGLRASFGSRPRTARFPALSLKQAGVRQAQSSSSRASLSKIFPLTSGAGASLAIQRAPQRARSLVEHTRACLPLHTIQFTASKSMLSGSSVETALARASARFPASSSNLSGPLSQERLQSQCQKS